MKTLILLLTLTLFANTAFASGGFECISGDKSLKITGTDSSAGTAVKTIEMDGVEYTPGNGFERSEMLNNEHQLAFKLMDADYNGTIVRVDTVKDYPLAAGLVWIIEKSPDTITCEFLY